MGKVINGICVGLAFLSLGLGILGILLPILPTTPFLLLAALLFSKSSRKFHRWFTATNLYTKHIQQTVAKKEMTAKAKAAVLFTISLLFTAGLVLSPVWYAKAVILLVAALHYYYFLFRIKTVKN